MNRAYDQDERQCSCQEEGLSCQREGKEEVAREPMGIPIVEKGLLNYNVIIYFTGIIS